MGFYFGTILSLLEAPQTRFKSKALAHVVFQRRAGRQEIIAEVSHEVLVAVVKAVRFMEEGVLNRSLKAPTPTFFHAEPLATLSMQNPNKSSRQDLREHQLRNPDSLNTTSKSSTENAPFETTTTVFTI